MKYRQFIVVTIFSILAFLWGCTTPELEERPHPLVRTLPIIANNENGITVSAEVFQLGEGAIIDHGFVYGISENPTIDSAIVFSMGPRNGLGVFSENIRAKLLREKTYFVRAYVQTSNLVVYGNQYDFVSAGGGAPEVISFAPAQGVIGDSITIVGKDFLIPGLETSVQFGDSGTKIISLTDTLIVAEVPPFAVGSSGIAVFVADVVSNVVQQQFEIYVPEIVGLSHAVANIGEEVILEFKNFSKVVEYNSLKIGEFELAYEFKSDNTLAFQVPDSVTSYSLEVQATIGEQSTDPVGLDLKRPVILDFTPKSGTIGTEVTIVGTGFSPIASLNSVFVNGVEVTPSESGATEIKVQMPSATPGSYDIDVAVFDSLAETNGQFEYWRTLITGMSPLSVTWNETVTISGVHFGDENAPKEVWVGGNRANIVSSSDSEIQFRVPLEVLETTADVEIRAVSIGDQRVFSGQLLTFKQPQIQAVSKTDISIGEQFTVTGENFHPHATVYEASLAGIEATVVTARTNLLVLVIPSATTGALAPLDVNVGDFNFQTPFDLELTGFWTRVADGPSWETLHGYTYGSQGAIFYGLVSAYDIALNQWVRKIGAFRIGNFGGSLSRFVSFQIGDSLYAGTGKFGGGSSYENRFAFFDGTAQHWNVIAALPAPGRQFAKGFSIGRSGFVGLGRLANGTFATDFWRYDTETDSWTQIADFPGTHSTAAVAFGIAGHGYISTGEEIWQYDPIMDQWTRKNDFPGGYRVNHTVIQTEDRVIIGLGSGLGVSSYNDLWEYDPSSDSWERIQDFFQSRSLAGGFLVGDKLFIGGGYDRKEDYYFSPLK